jgi:hypothetical protein
LKIKIRKGNHEQHKQNTRGLKENGGTEVENL